MHVPPPHPRWGSTQTQSLWRGRSLYAFNSNINAQSPKGIVKFQVTPYKALKVDYGIVWTSRQLFWQSSKSPIES